jgi:PAS domain S-box-containing protein
VSETFFAELSRYVRFSDEDKAALRELLPSARSHFRSISEEFYARLSEHEQAKSVFSGPAQVERLKSTLVVWMEELMTGPWDEAYYQKRTRIGRIHVRVGLPQRYMFAAMNVLHASLQNVVYGSIAGKDERRRTITALAKIIDLELAIMLETYREAFVDHVQRVERIEKAQLQDELAFSQARYHEIVEKAWSLVTTFDERARVLFFNPRCEELTGIDRSQAIGRNWLEIFVPPDAHREVEQSYARVLGGERVAPWEGPVPCAPGPGVRRVRWHFTTLPTGAGPVLCAIGIDVTEERALQSRTRRAERLASLGTMAAGLAHEIRNPLNAASLQLTLVKRRLEREAPDVSGAMEAAQLVTAEMKRLAQLVEEFLQFARPQALRLRRSDLCITASELVSLVRPEAQGSGVELHFDASGAFEAPIDEERIKQVLHNLVRNAIEATGKGGHVALRLRPAGIAGDQVLIEVEDDGPGLPSTDAPIFEPFFTTKASGTGLGLSIVHRIVSDHGGKIEVSSNPGKTIFSITLPAL